MRELAGAARTGEVLTEGVTPCFHESIAANRS